MKTIVLISSLILLLPGCSGGHHRDSEIVVHDRPVTLEIEVYEPASGFVWQNVAVRIVEADQEWADAVFENPETSDWLYTDADGLVFFDDVELAIADVGFRLDSFGRAVIGPGEFEDQATILLEVYSPGLGTEFFEVDLSWDEPRVFVSIPF